MFENFLIINYKLNNINKNNINYFKITKQIKLIFF